VSAGSGQVLRTEIPDLPVVGVSQLRPEWLVQTADDHQQGLWPVAGVVVQVAEQPVVMTPGTIDADLEPSRHVALHGLPVSAARKSLRGSRRNLGQYRSHCRSNLNRAGIEKFSARYRLTLIIIAVPTKEHHLVRVIRRRPNANLRRARRASWLLAA
jgi:hypothetical protein